MLHPAVNPSLPCRGPDASQASPLVPSQTADQTSALSPVIIVPGAAAISFRISLPNKPPVASLPPAAVVYDME